MPYPAGVGATTQGTTGCVATPPATGVAADGGAAKTSLLGTGGTAGATAIWIPAGEADPDGADCIGDNLVRIGALVLSTDTMLPFAEPASEGVTL